MARRTADPAEKARKAAQREAEAKRLSALRENDPEAYKNERHRIRQENFRRVAVRRTNSALKALEMVKPIANRNNYAYEDEQAAKILHALSEKLDEVMACFQPQTDKADPGFEL